MLTHTILLRFFLQWVNHKMARICMSQFTISMSPWVIHAKLCSPQLSHPFPFWGFHCLSSTFTISCMVLTYIRLSAVCDGRIMYILMLHLLMLESIFAPDTIPVQEQCRILIVKGQNAIYHFDSLLKKSPSKVLVGCLKHKTVWIPEAFQVELEV